LGLGFSGGGRETAQKETDAAASDAIHVCIESRS
jgi:hypothetical protein